MNTEAIDKEFILSDSSVNSLGFRLLTSGYQKQEYERNPIGYYMHKREDGVLLRWEHITVKGDKITAYPNINLSNARGEQTVQEISDGFLNAASVGHIVVLEYSDDPKMKLEGQTGPTITKWYNKECSLVDVPGNSNALALMYDGGGNAITLASLMQQKQPAVTPIQPETKEANRQEPPELFYSKAELFDNGKAESIKTGNVTLFAALYGHHYGIPLNKLNTQFAGIDAKLCAQYLTRLNDEPYTGKAPVRGAGSEDKVTDFPECLWYSWEKLFKEGEMEKVKAKDMAAYAALLWWWYDVCLHEVEKRTINDKMPADNILINPDRYKAYCAEMTRRRVEELVKMGWKKLEELDLMNELEDLSPGARKKLWAEEADRRISERTFWTNGEKA